MKIYIDGVEVLCDKNITITEEMLSTSSVILNNVFPKEWDTDKDYTSRFYFPKDYSKCKILDKNNNLLFCGVVKNTGNISLNPFEPHYASLQILDFKTLLSEGTTLDFVINEKTVLQAINMVIDAVADYGVALGEVKILNPDEVIGAYNTQNMTAYDVFQYLSEITNSRWYTRLNNENEILVDFYDPSLMEEGLKLEYNREYFRQHNIIDMSYSYSSSDYRNKQVITGDDIYGDRDYVETSYADGYKTIYNTMEKIGTIKSITVDGISKTFVSNEEKEIGFTADFYYKLDSTEFESEEIYPIGTEIVITYVPLIKGRQIVLNKSEINRITNQINRNGVISRYESRNDARSSSELKSIAQTYIDYKGTSEITLTIKTEDENLWNIGEIVRWNNAPLTELTKNYMVKKKTTERIIVNSYEKIFYTFELSSNFNTESAINFFDNQRRKATGNIEEGNFIDRNIDIESTANVIFDNLQIEGTIITGDNVLQFTLGGPLVK